MACIMICLVQTWAVFDAKLQEINVTVIAGIAVSVKIIPVLLSF